MTNQMWQSIKTCMCCLQHEGSLSKAPLHPIMATTPLDLLHVDFTSIETTLELNKSPKVTNILVFQDHLQSMYWHMWPLIKQPKPSPSSCIRVPSWSLEPQPGSWVTGVLTFMSSVIDKMCEILGMKTLQTMSYHPQTNGLVERMHQTLMRMIGKLGEDKKADWPGHLAEIVHAYNATHSTMTRYSPHYLMFGQRPNLPVDFYFPTFRST